MTAQPPPPSPVGGVEAGRRPASPERAAYVRAMFSAIAARYDRTNAVISVGLHHRWKRETVRALALRPGMTVLDLCCGTGDLAWSMAPLVGAAGRVIGVDFAGPMVARARGRGPAGPAASPAFLAGDALRLPFADGAFDAVAVGFGLRNVADPGRMLAEVRRVLRPGGRLAILEFARARRRLLRALYALYAYTLMAGLGRLVSRHPDAYLYLAVSVHHWLDQPAVIRLLREAGLVEPAARDLAQGIVAIYTARVPPDGQPRTVRSASADA